MKERRSLAEGISPATSEQQALEKSFVFGSTDKSGDANTDEQSARTDEQPDSVQTPVPPAQPTRAVPHYAGRVPMTARTRPEVASAIKRAALTRQLEGVMPYSVQDIVEEALELWLHTNGYRID